MKPIKEANGNVPPIGDDAVTAGQPEPGSPEDLDIRARGLLLSLGVKGDGSAVAHDRKVVKVAAALHQLIVDAIQNDPKIPKLMEALIGAEPLFIQMRDQARTNLGTGRNMDIALATNRMMNDLLTAMEAFKDK